MNTNHTLVRLFALLFSSLPLSGFAQTTLPILSSELSAHHVPLAKSSIHLDTLMLDYRPLVSATGGDWTSSSTGESFQVMALRTTGAQTTGLTEAVVKMEASLGEEMPIDVHAPVGVDVQIFSLAEDGRSSTGHLLRIQQSSETIYLRTSINETTLLKKFLSALAIASPGNTEDLFADLPLAVTVPEEFPFRYVGKAPMVGHAFEGTEGTLVGLDDGAMMSELVALDEATLRSQVGEEAVIHRDGNDLLVYGYDESDGTFQVFGLRSIGGKIVALMGQGKHQEGLEAQLLSLLKSLQAR